MKAKLVLLIVTVMTVAASLGIAARFLYLRNKPSSQNVQPPFTRTSRITEYKPDGSIRRVLLATKYVARDGSWRDVKTNEEGKKAEGFYEPGRGVFMVDKINKTLVLKKRATSNPAITRETAQTFLANPQFVRTEQVLGLTAYVLRIQDELTGETLSDVYMAVELGSFPLKVIHYEQGTVNVVDEPLSIEFAEVDPSLVRGPNYPVVNR